MVKTMEMDNLSQRQGALATSDEQPQWLADSMLGAGLLLLALLLFNLLNSVSAMANPQTETAAAEPSAARQLNPDWPSSGTLQLYGPQGEITPPILTTQVNMRISGWTNRVTVSQSYTNESDNWLHGRYLFPLPQNAAVDSLTMKIGERTIEGQIQPKQKAKQIYQQAKKAGKRASLLSQQRPNLFTTEVANLGPGETIKVEFSYQQQVTYREGALSVRFPMTYTPRYLPVKTQEAPALIGNPVAAAISGPMQHLFGKNSEKQQPSGDVSIQLSLDAGMALASAASTTHQMHHTDAAGTAQTFELDNVIANRDFIFQWQPATGSAPQAVLFSQQGQTHEVIAPADAQQPRVNEPPQDYSLLMLMPPQSKPEHNMPRELVLVVDTSGSMSGDSMAQAKSAVRYALTSLTPQDSFNVLAFSSDVMALAPQSLPASAWNIGRAQQFVAALDADGGTEMGKALDHALPANYHVPNGVLRQVIFMTDGAVGNEKQLFDFIQQRLGDSRLFTVGIGSAPNGYFMQRAASAGRGTFTYIGYGEDVEAKTVALLAKIAAPIVTNVQLRFNDGTVPDYWPTQIPDLYLGEPMMVSIKQPHGRHQGIHISGTVAGQFWQQQLALEAKPQQSGLDLLWARGQIGALAQAEDSSNRTRTAQQITALAMKYHLVSKYTSLVAVDVTPVNPDAQHSANADIPSNTPAGWQPAGKMPQTATNSRLLLLLGALMLLLGFIMLRGLRVSTRPAA